MTKGSGNGIVVWQLGIGTMLGEEAVLLRQDTANARGDVQKPSQAGLVVIRRRRTTQDKVLYPL